MPNYNFQQYVNKTFYLDFEHDEKGNETLQPITPDGKVLGSKIIVGSDRHRFLHEKLPDQFPSPPAVKPSQRVNITRDFSVDDWKALGFKTRKEGVAFVRQLGIDIPDLDTLRQHLPQPFRFTEANQMMNVYEGYNVSYSLVHEGRPSDDVTYLSSLEEFVRPLLSDFIQSSDRPARFQLYVRTKFLKARESVDFPFSSKVELANNLTLSDAISEAVMSILSQIDAFQLRGSGFVFEDVLVSQLNMWQHDYVKGSSWLPLPSSLEAKKCVHNIKNPDNLCFWYSCLDSLYPNKNYYRESYPGYLMKRYSKVHPFRDEDFSGGFSLKSELLRYYERVFQANINVATWSFKLDRAMPMVASGGSWSRSINLLLLDDGHKTHFVSISAPDRLFYDRQETTKHKFFGPCWKCLFYTRSLKAWQHHQVDCQDNAHVRMPEEVIVHTCGGCGFSSCNPKEWQDHMCEEACHEKKKVKPTMRFKRHSARLRLPYVIYADSETSVCDKRDPKERNINSAKVTTLKVMKTNSIYAVLVNRYTREVVETFNSGITKDANRLFIDWVRDRGEWVNREAFLKPRDMSISEEQEEEFHHATTCCICEKRLSKDRVRHHCHYTGFYLGPAHNRCNLQLKTKNIIPVVFHNLGGFDGHFLLRSFNRQDYKTVKVLPNTAEKFKSFTLRMDGYEIRFIDSLLFLSSSIDKITQGMDDGKFHYTRLLTGSSEESFQMMRRKGAYPYDYVGDDWSVFDDTELPPMERFISMLKHSTTQISDLSEKELHELQVDYKRAQAIWDHFQCRTFADFHMIYLTSDVYLLADMFESFCDVVYRDFGLDPCHYYGTPGLGWDALLKVTGVKLELLTNQNDYLFMEAAKIGGVSSVLSKKYAKANNKYMKSGYDPDADDSYIMYVDANNMYGWAMCLPMPYGGFQWLNQEALELFKQRYMELPTDGKYCFYVEFDVMCPKESHDYQSDYPCFPEVTKVQDDMLNPKTQLAYSTATGDKLTLNLQPKTRYKTTLKLLQQAVELGWKVTRIHRVFVCNQKPWMEPYVEMCTKKRQAATSEFEKDLWKLFVVAPFGKSMEDVRRHQRVELVAKEGEEERYKRLTRSNHILGGEGPREISETMVTISLVKRSVCLNKPIYCGIKILHDSKWLMYDFWYKKLKPMYGSNACLLYTDTDSFIYQVNTTDHLMDIKEKLSTDFDLSNFPKDYFLFDSSNKKVRGKFKIETADAMILESCLCRSKLYSNLLDRDCDGKAYKVAAKGVPRRERELTLKHAMFRDSILRTDFDKSPDAKDPNVEVSYYNMRSFHQTVYLESYRKVAINSADTKRYTLDNGIDQLPFGHYKLREIMNN